MKWLIWSNQHGKWWRPAECGYTDLIDEAGRYERTEADRIVADATCDGQLTHWRTDHVTGVEYQALDEVVVLAPMADHHLVRAVATTILGIGFEWVVGRPTAEDIAEAVLLELRSTCRNCGHPIIPLAASSTNWTHGRGAAHWQGIRCPRRLTGATPMVGGDLLAEFSDSYVAAGESRD